MRSLIDWRTGGSVLPVRGDKTNKTAAGRYRAAAAPVVLALGLAAAWLWQHKGVEHPRVIVLGLDGATWHVMDPEIASGKLPNLGKLVERGIRGDLMSSPPILSPVVWTTIFTGKEPQVHGVTGWEKSTAAHRRTKALWSITSQQELQTVVINVPGTWPPEEIRGTLVSGFPISGSHLGGGTGVVVTAADLAEDKLARYYRPAAKDIAAAAAALEVNGWSSWIVARHDGRDAWKGILKIKRLTPQRYYLSPVYRSDDRVTISAPKHVQRDLERFLRMPYIPEGPGWGNWRGTEQVAYLYDHLVEISRLQTRAAIFLLRSPWDLFVYVITLTDRVQHPYWSFMEPERFTPIDPELIRRYSSKVTDCYEEADRQIGELLSHAGVNTYVLVLSDHGFRPSPSPEKHIGEHDFTGIYIIAGPGISRAQGQAAHLVDITPTLLYLLEQPLAKDMRGRVIPTLRQQLKWKQAKIPTYEGTPRRFETKPVDEKIKKQLRSLGYLEE